MMHVIMSTTGTGGDVFPFVAMGRGLAAAGHRVSIVTNACYVGDIEAAGLHAHAVDDDESCTRMIQDGALLSTGQGWVTFVDRYVTPRIDREADILRRCIDMGPTVMLTRGTPGFAARIVAGLMQIPLIGVMMAPANLLGWALFEHLSAARVRPAVNACRRRLGLAPIESEQWRAWLRYDDSIGLWPDWYCPSQPTWPSSLRLVGFLPAEEPESGYLEDTPLRDLPEDRPNVLIAAGTGVFGGRDFFELAISGCREAGCRPIVVCRQRSLLPDTLPDGAIAVPSVPSLAALMRRVAVVCHHGGTGTMGQALAAGVPQLVIALGNDRPDNAERLRDLGVAELISPPERSVERVAATLRRLLRSAEHHRKCLEIARRMRETPALPIIRALVLQLGRSAEAAGRS